MHDSLVSTACTDIAGEQPRFARELMAFLARAFSHPMATMPMASISGSPIFMKPSTQPTSMPSFVKYVPRTGSSAMS